MLPLEFASGDWLLNLDDDECMEEGFADLLPELLADSRYTHYLFPTKWIASIDPITYFCGPPWYPDWHRRLFRNDKRIVWHAPRVHSGHRVQGPGGYEDRVALLHFERFARTPAERLAKLQRYQERGSTPLRTLTIWSKTHPRRRLESLATSVEAVATISLPPVRTRSCRVIADLQSGARRSQLRHSMRGSLPTCRGLLLPANASSRGVRTQHGRLVLVSSGAFADPFGHLLPRL